MPATNGVAEVREPVIKNMAKGLIVDAVFHEWPNDPFRGVEMEKRTASIKDEKGNIVFEQKGVEFPKSWSQLATNVVASKYFYGEKGTLKRENSLRQLIERVAETIADWGFRDGYFKDRSSRDNFVNDLKWLLLHQYGSFNSPVWFNVGIWQNYGVAGSANGYRWDAETKQVVKTERAYEHPQGSACFIQSVEDNMESIMDLAKSEAMLFKHGSGTGSDLSKIRSSREKITGGGKPSGPLSFMKVYDATAGVVKSAGISRRAAKIQTLLCRHPDIFEFVECKAKEEKKAHALIKAGYEANFNGEAYSTVCYQNSNLSVRLTDKFMKAVENGDDFSTIAVTTGETIDTFPAAKLIDAIAENAWSCGDPGVQFHDTINDWHTCPNTAPINSSNPCCFVGSTLVNTSSGKVRIEDLADFCRTGRDLGCAWSVDYSSQDHHRRILKPIARAWKAGETTKLVKIRTVRGLEFLCTPEHRFYLTDGSVCPAWDLAFHHRIGFMGSDGDIHSDFYHVDAILSVELINLDKPIPVYDIEVEDTHNFEITCRGADHGVIVSNSEYMFIDDSACNLASLNLLKFLGTADDDNEFDGERFCAACRIFIIAQDILVDSCSYPTAKIAENSHKFRPLGLGFANLGALLMANGLPYDSKDGRGLAAEIAAIMHGQANLTSSELASVLGSFEGYEANREPMLKVMEKHSQAVLALPGDTYELSEIWRQVLAEGRKHGYRNSQVSVCAPTGTISFMMDCSTTGIEPDIALVKYKTLAGGGSMKYANQEVGRALRTLGYDDETIFEIENYIKENDTIEGCFDLDAEHLPVFDCAFQARNGTRSIHHMGHVKMLAAIQPFLSGASSKTVNMSRESTVADIRQVYVDAWKMGIKAVAVYRDGSKESQPLNTSSDETKERDAKALASPSAPKRERLPDTRKSLTHKFDIQGHEGYITVGFYPDGRPGELFVHIAKEGSTVGGLMDVIGTTVSLGLQYGVPLDALVSKFAHSRFEPSGFTKNPDIPIAKSITDYIFRWIGMEFIPGYRELNAPNRNAVALPASPTMADLDHAEALARVVTQGKQAGGTISDAPPCSVCGAITIRAGACYVCGQCGTSSGCG